MSEANKILKFLICNQCNGAGQVAEENCHVCDGKGVIGYLDGYLLYWPLKIDRLHLKLDRAEKILHKIIFIALLLLMISGFASMAYGIYISQYSQIFTSAYWLEGSNPYFLVFWLSAVLDLYLIYFLSLARDKKQKVLAKKYQQEETLPDVVLPGDWQAVKSVGAKYKIDVSRAFSQEAYDVIFKAFELADKYQAMEAGSVHFLIAGLLVSSRIKNIFVRLGVDLDDLAAKVSRLAAKYPRSEGQTAFSAVSKKILLKAYRLAYFEKIEEVDAAEIISEAVKADSQIQEILLDLKVSQEKLDNVILWFRIRKILQKQWEKYRASSKLKSKTGIDRAMTAVQTQFLNKYSEDLTLMAKMGYLDLTIDRDKEYADIFRILEGSSVKAAILVGDPGVGKTAIIEGLAQKMIADDVPAFLHDKRLVSLSVSRLVAGASASEAQERLLTCLNEIIRARNVVLFIDNIHDLVGISGANSGGYNLTDVISEALAKNLFILLATTNPGEYAKYIEKTSLGNIIKKIPVSEPDLNGSIQILEGKVGFIEGKNNVFFSYDALEKAVKLTDRFVHDQSLPFKAIGLLEEAGVWAKTHHGQDYIISGNDVALLLSEKIKMPVSDISEGESAKLLNLEELLGQRVIGQKEAVSAVASSLRRARAELRDVRRPIANLLFLGPTGVGKTELAKAIAQVYFGSEDNMIRLDMSEYQEKDSINRLLGSPQGNGNSGKSGLLTEAVRQNPFTIVLLDELEKANPDILNVFLQVMDDGRLTDANGQTADFTNVILIATSNAQTSFIQEKVKENVPLTEIKKQLLETELKQYFKPEFINRFDNIIVFKPLDLPEVIKIAGLLLASVAKNLEAKGIHFQASDEAISELAQSGFDPQYGARPLRRVIQDKVDNALADFLLKGQIGRRDVAILEKGGLIRVEKAKEL